MRTKRQPWPQEMWNATSKLTPRSEMKSMLGLFGVEADLLADLVLKEWVGSMHPAYDLYAVDNDPHLQEGTFDIILDSQRSGCLHCRSHKGFCSAFPSSVSRPCLQGRVINLWPLGVRIHEEVFTESGWAKAGLTLPDSRIVWRISQGLPFSRQLEGRKFWNHYPKLFFWL